MQTELWRRRKSDSVNLSENGEIQYAGVSSAVPPALVSESESESRSVVSDSSGLHGLYSSWNSPGQNG